MIEKFDLNDLSIIIPVKIDFQDRINNLSTVLSFFDKYFLNYEIIVLEKDIEQKCEFLKDKNNIKYIFEKFEGLMHRTKMLNDGMKMSNRKYVSSYDTDVVFNPKAIQEAMYCLRNGGKFVFPYNGVFIDVMGELRNRYMNILDHDIFPKYDSSVRLYTKGHEYDVIHNNGVGGAILFEKETFLKYGGYNKKFISWGYEDNELVTRFSKLGITIHRMGGEYCLYHLNHQRGIDSTPSHGKINNNIIETRNVSNMNQAQLLSYIQNELL